jgi:hypothetical protein
MKDDTAHMSVVEIEHMPHLPIGNWRFKQSKFHVAAKYRCLRYSPNLLEHGKKL